MYYLFFVCIWLKNSIFGEFSNIYLLSAKNRVKWRHKIRPIAKNFRPILIFFARDDAKLMPGEVCQVSCRYSNKWRSYSRKTEGGVGSDPPPGGGGLIHRREVGLWPVLHWELRGRFVHHIDSAACLLFKIKQATDLLSYGENTS